MGLDNGLFPAHQAKECQLENALQAPLRGSQQSLGVERAAGLRPGCSGGELVGIGWNQTATCFAGGDQIKRAAAAVLTITGSPAANRFIHHQTQQVSLPLAQEPG